MPKNDLTLFKMDLAKLPIQEITDPAMDRNPAQNSPRAARANAYSWWPRPNRARRTRAGRPKKYPTMMARAFLVACFRMPHALPAAVTTALTADATVP